MTSKSDHFREYVRAAGLAQYCTFESCMEGYILNGIESSSPANLAQQGKNQSRHSVRFDKASQSEDVSKRPLAGLSTVVLGSGGAARALAFGAASRGSNVIVAGRKLEKAQQLATDVRNNCDSEVSVGACELDAVQQGNMDSMDVVLNCTPLGMQGKREGDTPVPFEILEKFKPLVFDSVYIPLHTKLLRDAEQAGCKTVTGLEMFVGQAAQQFELFTGKEPPVEVMRTTVLQSMKS